MSTSLLQRNGLRSLRVNDLGQVAPGCFADLLVLDGNPLDDVSIFERYRAEMRLVMKGGAFIRNEPV